MTSSLALSGEADVPRWRRPSVVAARFETDNTVILRAATVDLAAGAACSVRLHRPEPGRRRANAASV